MNLIAKSARRSLEEAQQSLKRAESAVRGMEEECKHRHGGNHQWGEAKDTSYAQEGYTIPGDPPGYGGADHCFEHYVPPKTIRRWERTCQDCGKTEETTQVKEVTQIRQTPNW